VGAIRVDLGAGGGSEELDRLEHRHGQERLLEARQKDFLQVQRIENRTAAELLAGQLDRGEAEAIVLAEESKADWLLMDERDGRLQARRMGLRVTGVFSSKENWMVGWSESVQSWIAYGPKLISS
jgi:predicted nucleic acid-binding protein